MVFITLGTQDKEFPRLLDMVEKLIDKGVIKGEVIAQIGSTKYKSDKIKLIKYMERCDLVQYIDNCEYLICHAGVGTIMDALSLNKKIIAVPRLSMYKEHVNDHQLDIVREFSKMGLILDGSDLEKAVKKVNKFQTKKYKSNTKNFINIIEDYIDNN